jgi:predicted nucleic acid-binding protein
LSFYLDTSVLVPLYLVEETSAAIESWMTAQSGALLVSDLTAGEFGAAASRLVRMRRLTVPQAGKILAAFEDWCAVRADRVENLPADIRLAGQLVRQPTPRLLMPDAVHLATCRRLSATLVTLDRDLVQVGKREGVDTFVPA